MSTDKTKKAMSDIFDYIEKKVPLAGFVVLLFPPGNPGNSNYICKGTREDLVKAASEVASRVQDDINQDRPSAGGFDLKKFTPLTKEEEKNLREWQKIAAPDK